MNKRDVVGSFDDDVEALMAAESRRGALLVVPFLLAALAAVWLVLGEATRTAGVRVAFGGCVATVMLRCGALRLLSRTRAVTASGLLVSVGFAGIYSEAGPAVSSVQLLMLTVVATAVCALGILGAAANLPKYAAYVSIHLGSLAIVIMRHGGPALVPQLPAMVVLFVVALTLIARKNNASVREKMVLSIEVRDFGLRDALTGLRNRAFVELFTEQRARQVVEQWQSHGRRKAAPLRSLALLLVDLDHFKQINDKHGHASGDQVLAAFAKVARSAVRAGDVVARWGGEEFLVVMEVDERETANGVAERLREMIAKSPAADASGRPIDVTCSIGACLFPFDATRATDLTWQETLELADGALYRAKSMGRNRTVWAQPDPMFTPRQLLEHERDDDVVTQVMRKVA